MKQKKNWGMRGFCAILSVGLLLSGCGVTGETVQTEKPFESSTEEVSLEEIVDTGIQEPVNEKIMDFYEYVAGAWLGSVTLEEGETQHCFAERADEVEKERLEHILKELDISNLSEDEGLYKAVTYYRQLADREYCNAAGPESLKAYADRIDKVKNLRELYELYKDDEYFCLNPLMTVRVQRTDVGEFNPFVTCRNIFYRDDEAENQQFKASLKDIAVYMGYSEKRSEEMVENAYRLDQVLTAYLAEVESNSWVYYIYEDQMKEAGVTMPFFEIMEGSGALSEDPCILANLEYMDLLKEVYVPELLPLIKDHMMVCAITNLGIFSDDTVRAGIFPYIAGVEYSEKLHLEWDMIIAFAGDVLNDYYFDTYVGEKVEQDVRDMADEIIKGMRSVISDADWLSVHGKELAKRKVNHLKIVVGKNDAWDDLSGVTLTDDPVKNGAAFLASNKNFLKSLLKTPMEPIVNGYNMFEVNAYYTEKYNAIVITEGWLADEWCGENASYEERLSYLGKVLAHEMSHAYDPVGSCYDEDGYREPWMKEDEEEKYQAKIEKIAQFFDGKTTEFGNTLDGTRMQREAFADLMGMDCCLRILRQRENPDYDTFFRCVALNRAIKWNEEGEKNYLESGAHLPPRFRVNCILGMFDEFYETYDIAEDSPFYVPAEQRISAF